MLRYRPLPQPDPEVATVKERRTRLAACIGVAGVVLALAPMGAASARPNDNPGANSAACTAIKNEQAGATAVGLTIERAMASGNLKAAKRQMLDTYNADLRTVSRALKKMKSAPLNVRDAFQNLRTFVGQISRNVKNAESEQQIVASFQSLSKNSQLQADATTIAAWAASVCGSPAPGATSGTP
jgi:hypothetical protein